MSCSLSNKHRRCLWSSWRSLQLPNVRWGEAFLFWQLCLNTSNGKSCCTTEGNKPAIMELASSLEHKKILLYGIQLPTLKVRIFSAPLSCLQQRCTTQGLLFSQGIWGGLVLMSSNRRFNIWLLPSELGAQTHHFCPSCRTQSAGRHQCWRYLSSYQSWSKRGAQLWWVSFYRPEGTFPSRMSDSFIFPHYVPLLRSHRTSSHQHNTDTKALFSCSAQPIPNFEKITESRNCCCFDILKASSGIFNTTFLYSVRYVTFWLIINK